MSIGTTIKKLRRERDITQEQLAEYIGISAQAVSQWETDKTAPDISQLPLLAHIFDVSTDEILGVDLQKNEEKIQEILDEAQAFYAKGEFEKSTVILKNGLRHFPLSYKLMKELTYSLRDTQETIDLCHKILAECTDSEIRDSAMQNLIYAYSNSDDKQSALEHARKMPHVWLSKEAYLFELLHANNDSEREEAKENALELISYMTTGLVRALIELSHKSYGYADEDCIKLLEQAATIIETIFCDGDYHFNAQFAADVYMWLSVMYAGKDAEKTLSCIEKEAELRIHFCTYDPNAVHTSPALRGYCSGGWIPTPDGNQCKKAAAMLREYKWYDFIREDPRFQAVIDKLEKYAK